MIPKNVAADVLFSSDRMCCVCNIRGKSVQIHHIDENPANNAISNLSVLCFDCHEETMVKGGFGRKLDADQVIRYRDDWIARVGVRRVKADELASISNVLASDLAQASEMQISTYADIGIFNQDPEILIKYLKKITVIHKAQLIISRTNWDDSTTADMIQGCYNMIDFYEEVLCEIATFLSPKHFELKSLNQYFNELISSRYQWYRMLEEPEASGMNGTMILVSIPSSVMEDLKKMIIDMVLALSYMHNLDTEDWTAQWNEYDTNQLP